MVHTSVLVVAAPPSRTGGCVKLGPGELTPLWFSAVLKVLSHSTPAFTISLTEEKAKAQGGSTICPNHTGGKKCLFIKPDHPPPCPRCLGEGLMFSKESEAGRTLRAVSGQP